MDVAKLQVDRTHHIETTIPDALMYNLLKLDIDDVAASDEAFETLLSLRLHVSNKPLTTRIESTANSNSNSTQHPHPFISDISSVSDTTVYESLGAETEVPTPEKSK
ncbi:UNVERIFIED_CONTAM: hypothetical protein HDU68_001818, partial [Siphonaria sp. JEL0065]